MHGIFSACKKKDWPCTRRYNKETETNAHSTGNEQNYQTCYAYAPTSY